MGKAEKLQFFMTNPHACSYLENREATAIFADPNAEMNTATFGALMAIGFRRSGNFIYKPCCANCSACIPVRIPVGQFKQSRSQKRIWKKNRHLQVQITAPEFNEVDYALYESYIEAKHKYGGMHPPTVEQYKSFLLCKWSNSEFIRFYDQETLVCVAVVDQIPGGLSGVYTYYHPDYAHLSLGTFSVLWQLDFCLTHAIPFLYLGYWIKECQKMNYKNQYKPYQIFINDNWQTIIPTQAQDPLVQSK